MIRAADAAAILGLGTEVIEKWLTEGSLHGSRSAEGNWLVCTGSMRGRA
jgi:hypothetical protein